jgi:phage host-nuclease inhibitor protein Gam
MNKKEKSSLEQSVLKFKRCKRLKTELQLQGKSDWINRCGGELHCLHRPTCDVIRARRMMVILRGRGMINRFKEIHKTINLYREEKLYRPYVIRWVSLINFNIRQTKRNYENAIYYLTHHQNLLHSLDTWLNHHQGSNWNELYSF